MPADLFAVYGPPTPDQARRLVLLLGLLPKPQKQPQAEDRPAAERRPPNAA
jgi:hypothetical protein